MLSIVKLPVEAFLDMPVQKLNILCGQQFLYPRINSSGARDIIKIDIIENSLRVDVPADSRVADDAAEGARVWRAGSPPAAANTPPAHSIT